MEDTLNLEDYAKLRLEESPFHKLKENENQTSNLPMSGHEGLGSSLWQESREVD